MTLTSPLPRLLRGGLAVAATSLLAFAGLTAQTDTAARTDIIAARSDTVAAPVLAQATADPTDTLARALLWRIDGDSLAAPSYLFGTIHLIGAEDFEISDSLMAALNRAENVTFEIDPGEMTDMGTQLQLMMQAFMKGDTTLRDLLTAEEYARVDAHFSDMGLPMMFLNRVKPMFLSMIASTDMSDLQGMLGQGQDDDDAEAEAGGGGMKSYELELNAIATQADKEIRGLETAAYQMGLFDQIPYPDQAQMLMQAIDSPEGSDQLGELAAIYASGDIEGMYRMSVGEDGGLSGHEETLLTRRNRNWVAPMREQALAGPTLFAVGAGHLGGPEGVVRLLRAAGFTLTPLSVR